MFVIFVGIVNSSEDSLFTYSGNDSWSTFYDPDFVPLFEPVFNDSSLENTTYEICKDDLFCIFDIAATKKTEIGMSTLQGTEDLEMIVEMSKPGMYDGQSMHWTYYFVIILLRFSYMNYCIKFEISVH